MFYVSKLNKRLWILNEDNQSQIYTPPEFLRNKLAGRSQLQKLCDEFNRLGFRDIGPIADFERQFVRG